MKKYIVNTNEHFHNQFEQLSAELDVLKTMFANPDAVVTQREMINWHGRATSVSGQLEELIEESMERFLPYLNID